MQISGFAKFLTAGAFAAGLAVFVSGGAQAAPLPVTSADTIAQAPKTDQVRWRGGYYRGGWGYRRGWGAGPFVAGAALGIIGAAAAANAYPYHGYSYPAYYGGYYPAYYGYGYGYPYRSYAYPAYYPAYYGGWGYRRAYWGPRYGYRRAYWGRPAFYGGRPGFYRAGFRGRGYGGASGFVAGGRKIYYGR